MLDHRRGLDRGFEYAPARSVGQRDVGRIPNRNLEEIIADKVADSAKLLASITVGQVVKLAGFMEQQEP